MSERYQSLSHSRWNCKYHVGFVPKRRRKKWFGEMRRQLGRFSMSWPDKRHVGSSKAM